MAPGEGPGPQPPALPPPPALTGRPYGGTRFWSFVLLVCAGAGALYGEISVYGHPWVGAIYGAAIGGAVMLFERDVLLPRLRLRLRRLPLAASVIATELVYIALVVAASAAVGSILKPLGVVDESWREALIPNAATLLYSLLVSAVVVTANRVRQLIGTEVFFSLLLGRYHHPEEEERIFLFIDLIGSTAYAQQHGDLRAQAFLGAIFAALAAPVRRCRGSIDDYVGDMALVTWPMASGVRDARCVACVFAFTDAIQAETARWRREFGQVPQFRAALHGGRVVTAEVGLDRHKIAFFGDVVNTTGRMEGLSRTLDAPVLISSDLLERMPGLPAGIRARNLGAHGLKGRGDPLAVFALEGQMRPASVRMARATLAVADAVADASAG